MRPEYRTALFFGALTLVVVALGCAHQPNPSYYDIPGAYDPPGFLYGLLHGLIAPIAFIGSIFSEVRMYAFPNSGVWYDFGYLLGLCAWAGGAASA
jgi:hypothetical protein